MSEEEITAEHTYACLGQVLEDIELLRLEMGRNRDARISMHIRDASPREVFYYAQTIHRKVSQLCEELGAPGVHPPDAAEPARAHQSDVLRVLESACERLSQARALLGLEPLPAGRTTAGPHRRAVGRDVSDLLEGCLLASRQLNAMLAQAFTSRQANERISRALATTEHFLKGLGVDPPPPPPFERRKFPREVYEVLWQTCEALNQVLRDSGLATLELRRGFVGEDPGDVFDIASLIVCELEYLMSFLSSKPATLAVAPSPARVLPSHNYQLARQLHAAMTALGKAVASKPGWLPRAREGAPPP